MSELLTPLGHFVSLRKQCDIADALNGQLQDPRLVAHLEKRNLPTFIEKYGQDQESARANIIAARKQHQAGNLGFFVARNFIGGVNTIVGVATVNPTDTVDELAYDIPLPVARLANLALRFTPSLISNAKRLQMLKTEHLPGPIVTVIVNPLTVVNYKDTFSKILRELSDPSGISKKQYSMSILSSPDTTATTVRACAIEPMDSDPFVHSAYGQAGYVNDQLDRGHYDDGSSKFSCPPVAKLYKAQPR